MGKGERPREPYLLLLKFRHLTEEGLFARLITDSVYQEAKQRHADENIQLAQELKPLLENQMEVEKILGLKARSDQPTPFIPPQRTEFERDQAALHKFIMIRLVRPDVINFVETLTSEGLVPDVPPEELPPIFSTIIEKRYVNLYRSWAEIIIERLEFY